MSTSTEADRPGPFVNPRPGVVKTLGVLNVVFSVILILILLTYVPILMAIANNPPAPAGAGAGAKAPVGAAADPLMGMNDPTYEKFLYADMITGLIFNGAMFACGVGMLNLRPWSGRWFARLAWWKIARLVLLFGLFLVVVAPVLAGNMAQFASAMVPARPGGGAAAGMPPAVMFARVYNIMFAIYAVGMMVFGSIYPAVAIWLLGKPEVRAGFAVEGPGSPAGDTEPTEAIEP